MKPPPFQKGRSLKKYWRAFLISGLALSFGFVFYLWILWGQLEQALSVEDQFVPTRIYSDATRIAPPQLRPFVEERLRALGYGIQKDETTIQFTLHPIDYPSYLIPDGHPTLEALNQAVVFRFDGNEGDSLLQSIEVAGKEIPELYLEPELVTTLSRTSNRSIRMPVNIMNDKEFPSLLWQAIIAVEDQHFLEHKGLDPRGIARAIWVNLRTLSFQQGGSTVTQQLVKNLMVRRTRNLFKKINELFLALLLDAKLGKMEILERYLNEVYLGQVGNLEVHGVAEGAKYFFGKHLRELNKGEIALVAGLIRGPNYYSPYRHLDRALERQKWVLKKMVETGYLAEEEAVEASKDPIRLAPPQSVTDKAPYFNDFVKAELIRTLKDKMTEKEIIGAGFRVYTTLDVAMNVAAQRAVANGVSHLEKQLKLKASDRLEGALASVDHNTGYIRALVGGRSYAQSNFNRILNMKRQVGSTFKPIVYLTSILKGDDSNGIAYGPGHPAEDAQWTLTYDRGKQTWTPKNYEKEYLGWTSFRTALAHSINTIAAKVGYEVGIENIIQVARALGIESDLPAVPSLSLGVAELSPVDLLRAYAIIANHGVQDDLTVIRGITHNDGKGYIRFVYHPKQAIDPGPTDLLTDMMQNVFTEGTARAAARLGFERPAAGKTGTTSNHRDSWFAGYTPQLTTVVWVGMDQAHAISKDDEDQEDSKKKKKEPKVLLTGATSALPIWIDFMKDALLGDPPTQFPISPYLVDLKIDIHSGKQSSFDCPSSQVIVEKYVKGREPKQIGCEGNWPQSVPKTEAQ